MISGLAEALIGRAVLRVETTATAALAGGDIDGAFVAAYDGYRMAAEALLARQALRATGGDGSHMAVEDAVSAQFGAAIPHSPSRHLSGSGVPVMRRSTSILARHRSSSPMPHGLSGRRRMPC